MSDELERLFHVLVRRIRDVRPENLSRPFEVGEMLRTFVPYRATRAEVGAETAEDYEVLVLRLLSGERGLIFAEDALQEDLRRELDSGNPDLRALHAYDTARVTLAQQAARQVLESAPPPRAPAVGEVSAALDALQQQLPPGRAELDQALSEAMNTRPRPSFFPRGHGIPDPTADAVTRTPRPGCRFCGQMLPAGREITFCPHCGQNLRVRRCPGCSAEIDPAWKFCVTCGRASAPS